VDSGFGEARIVELVAQCRPALPNNLPTVRWLGARCLQVNGLYRHGYLIAPAMHDVVLELMASGSSPLAQDLGLTGLVQTSAPSPRPSPEAGEGDNSRGAMLSACLEAAP